MSQEFKPGELIVYQCGDRFEVGKVKSVNGDHAFVWYSSGETAANTPVSSMHKLGNADSLGETMLGKGI